MGRTIRTCSIAAIAGALLVSEAPARQIETTALGAYVRARAADKMSDAVTAVANYSAALTLAADTTTVAFRAYRAGVDGGNYALALRAARALERTGVVPPDAQVLLYIAAVRDADWRTAATRLDRIEREDGFDFLAPLFRRWLASETGETRVGPQTAATAYVAENDILVAISQGDADLGIADVSGLWRTDRFRDATLRLAAAATLAAKRQRARALSLLTGDDPTIIAAGKAIAAGRRVLGAVDSPARGTAFVLTRMASDLMSERSVRSALTLARFAVFADPQSPNARLVTAAALGLAKRDTEALAIIDGVARDPVYADLAQSQRIDCLEALGRGDEAMAAATLRASRSINDLVRLGDIEARRVRFADAVTHYRRAVDMLAEGNVTPQLWLALANALDQSGDWAAARPMFERALALTPDDPRLLNQLGYGMAARGEELAKAVTLLRKADAARPDSAAITDSLGWAEYKSGRLDRAVTLLERARTLDPAEPEIGEHLGDAYWAAGRRIDARYAWTAARENATGMVRTRIDAKIDRGLP